MGDNALVIWVLKGARAGDTAQALALAGLLGGQVVEKQLAFKVSHMVPNWFAGARVSHITAEARSQLAAPWPDLVVATGRRTAPVALWVKQQSGGKAKTIQIGRPRMALSAFDLVITTPQYGLPQGANVLQLPVPFAMAKAQDPASLAPFRVLWAHLPRPWILAAIGGAKFPQHLGKAERSAYGAALNRRAQAVKGSVILFGSPRSDAGAVAEVAAELSVPHWSHSDALPSNGYQSALGLCDECAVTSDSVSMLTEMMATGKPTHVFTLPVSPLALRWSADSGVFSALAKRGILHPPRDVDRFARTMIAQGAVGDLRAERSPRTSLAVEQMQRDAVARIRTLLAAWR